MSEVTSDIGMIGLGVMGGNLVLNLADRGLRVGVFNRTESVTQEFVARLAAGQQVQASYSLAGLLEGLEPPRRIMLMVNAGSAVDSVLGQLDPLLQPGDIVIDGGNSHFKDTDRRAAALADRGVHYLGVGISGGESGARHGPSMMPGGPAEAYEAVRPLFEAVAARVDGRPCVAHLGPGSAGHYVKMVHNGIEYAVMQLIAESYGLLKQGLSLDNDRLADLFAEWQEAELGSYLLEITAQIFRRRDEQTGGHLIDFVAGEAGQKGTGMWTSQSALDLGVPAPCIDAAVSTRNLSALASERTAARESLTAALAGPAAAAEADRTARGQLHHEVTAASVRSALYAAMVVAYTQGFALLARASEVMGYSLALGQVASVWRGGCIIRAKLLEQVGAAFERRPDLSNLLLDAELGRAVASRRADLAAAVTMGVAAGIPVAGLSAALSYLDAYVAGWLPMNLIQAQRDFFGAHTYRRIDREGVFHTDWSTGSS